MNVENRTLFIADNLDIMRGMDSETIDLIYLDPPFNSNRNYKAPIGSPAEGAEFKDIWTDEDIKYEWHGQIASEHEELYQIIKASETVYDKSMKIYLMAIAVRLFEMHRILKTTGSIYLHCDPTASHYLKLIMDDMFGKQNFRNEIVWFYNNRLARKASNFSRLHDILLVYGKTRKTKHNLVYDDNWTPSNTQQRRFAKGYEIRKGDLIIYDEEKFQKSGLDENGFNQVYRSKASQPPIGDVWSIPILNPMAKERTGYPTQKPLALLERIIKASSNDGDIVLDPFCGCATACVAAESLQRQWIGIDISPSAEVITKLRLDEASLQGNFTMPLTDVIVRHDAPVRTDNAEEIAIQMRLPKAETHKPELFGRQQGKCNGCQYPFHYRNLTIDHIVPHSKVKDDRIENLQLLCASCNSTKGKGTHPELIRKLKERNILRTE